MLRALNVRRSVALTAALVVTAWGSVALPAGAEAGSQAHGDSNGQAHAPGQQKDKPGEKDKDKGNDGKGQGAKGQGGSHGSSGDHGSSGSNAGGNAGGNSGDHGNAGGNGGGNGDPAGNNGTVKIAPLGEMDSIPNNTPHPGCTFQVEWYGYDEGADIVSTVSFAMQAPTKDVALAVDGPGSVFVGGDPASGAGTDTGLDGREAYTLSFTGEPHPKQGYHVKLTVATPRSKGNDTKTKVFWVEPCESGSDTGDDSGTGTSTDTETPGTTGTETDSDSAESGDDTEVLGTQASTGPNSNNTEVSPAQAQGGNGSVPTAVDAGENGHSAFGDFVRSPWPLLLAGLGALLTVATFVSRRRHGVDGQD